MRSASLLNEVRSHNTVISVGMLTANWMALGSELKLLESVGVRLLHFDVMDGVFCPTLTFGAPVIAGLKTSLFKDVHLMISEPLDKLASFVAAGADIITLHAESTRHAHRALQELGKMTNANDPSRGILRGLALNPGTPLSVIEPLIEELDLVLLLAVNPGWNGQKLISNIRERVSRLKEIVGDKIFIGVDGGVTRENISEIAQMGMNVIVTGSAVFDGKAPADNARFVLQSLQQ